MKPARDGDFELADIGELATGTCNIGTLAGDGGADVDFSAWWDTLL
jgi:hypothetical protein